MTTKIQRQVVSVRTNQCRQCDRIKLVGGVLARSLDTTEECRKLSASGCRQRDRLAQVMEHFEQAKKLLLQIAVLETDH